MPKSTKRQSRGRPPKGQFVNKSATLTTRITPDLRGQLDLACRRNGLSLSQEVERRLDLSFVQEERTKDLIDAFGGIENFQLFRLAARAIGTIEFITGSRARTNADQENVKVPRPGWLNDPFTFDLSKEAIDQLIEYFRPQGERVQSDRYDTSIPPEHLPAAVVLGLLDQVRIADDDPPKDGLNRDGSTTIHAKEFRLNSLAKEALGKLMERRR